MENLTILLLLGSLVLAGCEFVAGAATGALATGAGYEINAKRQMDRLDDDYRRERIGAANMSAAEVRSSEVRSCTEFGVNFGH